MMRSQSLQPSSLTIFLHSFVSLAQTTLNEEQLMIAEGWTDAEQR